MKKNFSLQWQLTLMTALLVTVSCLILSYFISKSAILYMDEIEDSVIAVLPKEVITGEGTENTDFYIDITGDLSGNIQDTQTEFWGKSLLATLIIVLISSAMTYFIVGYALWPLQELRKQVGEIQEKNMQQPVNVKNSSYEIESLTEAFNNMLSRLSEAFFTQRQFSANAAHELRTPLAVMQTKLEVFEKEETPSAEDYAETMGMVKTQTERLSHVIDVLLEMTELQSAKRSESISLEELAEEVLCDLAPLGDKKNVSLLQTPGDAMILGNSILVYRAIYNLVENAIKYNKENGQVLVEIRKETPFACVFIADTGVGVSDADREKIFAPFFRVDKSRSREMGGAGLGLALVKEIAKQHGGNVGVVESSEQGTKIELKLLLNE